LRRSAGEVVTDESIIEAHPELMPELAEWPHIGCGIRSFRGNHPSGPCP
jgi:hypothetical protein